MKQILNSLLILPIFLFFANQSYAADTSYIAGSSVTSTCGGSTMLSLDLSGFNGCVPYWEDPSTFSVNNFDISSIPNGQDLKFVTVKFWVNNSNNDTSVHYTPELTVTSGCVVSGAVIEPTSSVWDEVTRTFDISSCNLTSTTDTIQKVQITRNNTSGAGSIDYIALKVKYAAQESYSLNDKTSNRNNLTNTNSAAEVATSLPFSASTKATDFELSSSQSLSIADNLQTGLDFTGNHTYEMWVKLEQLPSTAGTHMGLVGKWTTTTQYLLLITADNKVNVYFKDNSGNSTEFITTNATFVSGDVGQWVHIAVSVTAGTPSAVVYKNGVSQAVSTVSTGATSVRNTGDTLRIGSYGSTPAMFLDGVLDEVRIWNTARTSTQVTDNMNTELTGTESGLVGYFPFESQYDINDKTSNLNNLTNNGNVSDVSSNLPFGASTKASDFELSSSQSLTLADASQIGLDFTGNHTYEMWVKLEQLPSTAGTHMGLVGKWAATTQYLLLITTDNKLNVYFKDNSGNTTEFISTNATFVNDDVGQWVHIAVSVTAGTPSAVVYKNGVSQALTTVTANATSVRNTSDIFRIGAYGSTPAMYLDGVLDEVRIWNTARTSTQVTDSMHTQLTGSESGLVAYFPFENLSGASPTYALNDRSTFGLTLTNYGSTRVTSNLPTGDTYYATDFESSASQYLTAPDSNSLNQSDLTIETWVKFESLPASGSAMSIAEKLNAFGFHLWNDSGTYKLRITHGTTPNVTTAWTPTTGTWYHVAVVYEPHSSSYVKFYVNGTQQGSTINSPGFAGSAPDNANLLYIGAKESGGGTTNYLDGQMDDLRIWNISRTDTQINRDMNIELYGSLNSLSAYYPFESL